MRGAGNVAKSKPVIFLPLLVTLGVWQSAIGQDLIERGAVPTLARHTKWRPILDVTVMPDATIRALNHRGLAACQAGNWLR